MLDQTKKIASNAAVEIEIGTSHFLIENILPDVSVSSRSLLSRDRCNRLTPSTGGSDAAWEPKSLTMALMAVCSFRHSAQWAKCSWQARACSGSRTPATQSASCFLSHLFITTLL